MILESVKNTNINNPNSGLDIPYLLKLKKVDKRFVSRATSLTNIQIQFGVGSPSDIT
jgi:hypothetical protein